MEELLKYAAGAIIFVMGITKGITIKIPKVIPTIKAVNPITKEIITIIISGGAVIYYIWFIGVLTISEMIFLFVAIYLTATGVYNIIPSGKPIIEGGQTEYPELEAPRKEDNIDYEEPYEIIEDKEVVE